MCFIVQMAELGGVIIVVFVFGFILFPLMNKIPLVGSYKIDFMLPFFLLGMAVKRNIQLNWSTLALSSLGFLICLTFWRVDDIWYTHMSKWLDYKEIVIHKNISLNISSIWHYVFRFFTGAFGSIAFITAFKMMDGIALIQRFYRVAGKYGKMTLEIYLIQSFIIEVNPFHLSFPQESVFLYSYVYSLLYTIFSVVICIVIARFLLRNYYISLFVFGKK